MVTWVLSKRAAKLLARVSVTQRFEVKSPDLGQKVSGGFPPRVTRRSLLVPGSYPAPRGRGGRARGQGGL